MAKNQKQDLSAFISKAKENKTDVPMQKVVPVVPQQVKKEKVQDKTEKDIINTKVFLDDFDRLKKLKKHLADYHNIFSYQIASVFSDGLVLLKEKYKFKEVPEDQVALTVKGQRAGSTQNLTPEDKKKIAKRNTTVKLDPEITKMYNDYKTFKVKENTEINTADLFREMLEAVEKKYKIT